MCVLGLGGIEILMSQCIMENIILLFIILTHAHLTDNTFIVKTEACNSTATFIVDSHECYSALFIIFVS